MTDNPRDRLPYRQCAGIVLFNREGNVFVGKRLDETGSAWQLPQGGIEKEEAPGRQRCENSRRKPVPAV